MCRAGLGPARGLARYPLTGMYRPQKGQSSGDQIAADQMDGWDSTLPDHREHEGNVGYIMMHGIEAVRVTVLCIKQEIPPGGYRGEPVKVAGKELLLCFDRGNGKLRVLLHPVNKERKIVMGRRFKIRVEGFAEILDTETGRKHASQQMRAAAPVCEQKQRLRFSRVVLVGHD